MVTPKFLGILKIKTDISIAYHMVKFSGILKIKTDISIAYHMKSFMCHLTTNNKLWSWNGKFKKKRDLH